MQIYARRKAYPQTGCAFFLFQKWIKPTQNWKNFFYRAQKGYAQGTQSYLIDGLDKLLYRLVGIDTVCNIFGGMPQDELDDLQLDPGIAQQGSAGMPAVMRQVLHWTQDQVALPDVLVQTVIRNRKLLIC